MASTCSATTRTNSARPHGHHSSPVASHIARTILWAACSSLALQTAVMGIIGFVAHILVVRTARGRQAGVQRPLTRDDQPCGEATRWRRIHMSLCGAPSASPLLKSLSCVPQPVDQCCSCTGSARVEVTLPWWRRASGISATSHQSTARGNEALSARRDTLAVGSTSSRNVRPAAWFANRRTPRRITRPRLSPYLRVFT